MRAKLWTEYNGKQVTSQGLSRLCNKLGVFGYTEGVLTVRDRDCDGYTALIRYSGDLGQWLEYRDGDWVPIRATVRAFTEDTPREITDTLRDNPDITSLELLRLMGMSQDAQTNRTVRRLLADLEEQGCVESIGARGRTVWRAVPPTPKTQQEMAK